jgi:DNA repair protein RadA/Sms
LIAIEVLLNKTSGKYPLRRCIGVDAKRVDMIIAILEKYCQCKLSFVDIYLNIPGEFRFADAGMDVAIAAAILSQYHSKPLSSSTVYLGELGLTGHLSSTKAHTKRTATIADTELSLIDHATYSHIIQLAKDI